jgi:hypothetical protein
MCNLLVIVHLHIMKLKFFLERKKLFDVTKGSFVFRKKSKRKREREIEKEIDDVKTFFLPTGFKLHVDVDSQQIVFISQQFSNECFFVF